MIDISVHRRFGHLTIHALHASIHLLHELCASGLYLGRSY
jgi:hypothetical protein